jgi:hypothetical protein
MQLRDKVAIAVTVVFLALAGSAQAQISSRQFGVDFSRDVSGMVTLDRTRDDAIFLVAHDNKYPDEDRLGIVAFIGNQKPTYRALQWPEGVTKPVDIECLAVCPDGKSYIIMTSRGHAMHLSIDESFREITILHEFKVPVGTLERPELEGFSLQVCKGDTFAFWGDRGSDDRPATVFWGRFDFQSCEVRVQGQVELKVPWPTLKEVRHLSELRVDNAGILCLTAASEASDDGPFDSAFYVAGSFQKSDNGSLQFVKSNPMVPLSRFPGHKVEAFDLIPGPNGGAVFATDDEHEGSAIFLNW